MKAVIYARVSTQEQTTENQTEALAPWIRARYPDADIVKVYQENESAWKAGHQKELAQLLLDAHHGRFEIIFVWALDRLTREGATAILQMISRLKNSGVRVISYQEPWTEAPGEFGEVLYAIAGWVARTSSQRRSERTKAGMARARAAGAQIGRPVGAKDKKQRQKRTVRIRA